MQLPDFRIFFLNGLGFYNAEKFLIFITGYYRLLPRGKEKWEIMRITGYLN